MPGLALVAAMARNRVIGRDNALPWHLPEDLARFKRLTLGHPVLMGRLTHESIGRPLPGRENLVLTRRRGYRAEGCVVVTDLEAVLERYRDAGLMVIGGGELYAQTLPRAVAMHLTLVDVEVPGDACFPPFDEGEWTVTSEKRFPAGPDRPLGFRFVDYRRLTPAVPAP